MDRLKLIEVMPLLDSLKAADRRKDAARFLRVYRAHLDSILLSLTEIEYFTNRLLTEYEQVSSSLKV